MTIFLNLIDWSRPWLQELQPIAAPILSAPDLQGGLNDAARRQCLHNQRGLPLRFVPQAALPAGVAYETFIWESGCVPTRDNLHDFFNALVWLAYPRIKSRLNALQAAEIERRRACQDAGAVRGAVRDGLTIFDENAALVIVRRSEAGRALKEAITAHRWQDAFLEQRAAFGLECDVHLFGHALMEKLVCPYKAITAHARFMEVEDAYFSKSSAEQREWVDVTSAAVLEHTPLSDWPKAPLPLAGIPSWFPGQNVVFYNDVEVFRPKQIFKKPSSDNCSAKKCLV